MRASGRRCLTWRGPLEVDLEEDVLARGWLGMRCAVEVAEELGPLEKAPVRHALLEAGAVDERRRRRRTHPDAGPASSTTG